MKLFLDSQWQSIWHGKDPFLEAKAISGKVYRSKEGRRTLRFEMSGKGYFLKLHEGVGWAEILKNLLQLRLPVLGAVNEYLACNRLQALGVDTMKPVAFGETGFNPAKKLSFLITEELANTISLEDYCKTWSHTAPSLREKRAVIRKLADITKTLHDNGINHRDYYLCHFLREDNKCPFESSHPLYLIDLHRVQIRQSAPRRWIVKDLAGLFYSAFDLPLTKNDIRYFISCYRREWLRGEDRCLVSVIDRAVALYCKDFAKEPPATIKAILAIGK